MLDKEIREPLFDFLEEFYGKIRIFEEKITGMSRADALGVVDGQLIGFEIKSDHDTYARLKRQTADYDELCDINYLVVGKSHRKQADQHIPKHWGILCVYEENVEEGRTFQMTKRKELLQNESDMQNLEQTNDIQKSVTEDELAESGGSILDAQAESAGKVQNESSTSKRILVEIDQIPGVNPNVKLTRQLDLLWRPELALLQERNMMPKYRQESKDFVRKKILERVPAETLKRQITELLFERDYEALLAQIREVQKTTRPRRRNMSEQRRTIKAVQKKRSAAKKRVDG